MKTPDEIKKGLATCSADECHGQHTDCPYHPELMCIRNICDDALAYIQQLESDKRQLEWMLTHMNQLRDAAAGRALKMEERVHQLEAERDAAVKDIRLASTSYVGLCQTCKHGENQVDCDEPEACGLCKVEDCPCRTCGGDDRNWEWRGV